MDLMPGEVISHILQFLTVSDRNEAALVCKQWYNASLHPQLQRDVIVKCRPQSALPPIGLACRRLNYLSLEEWEEGSFSEEEFVALLKQCPDLQGLDISRCNTLFLSGKLLEKSGDVKLLRDLLLNVTELKLGCLRHMTDVTFLRLVSTMGNLTHISLASTNMILGNLLDTKPSSAMLNFGTVLNFIVKNASKLKIINLSRTSIHDEALTALAKVDQLCLEELMLQSCTELTDKGLKAVTLHQTKLQVLDISGCKEMGSSKAFFSNLSRLPKLHTLILRKIPKLGQCDVDRLADMKKLTTIDMGETLNLYEKDITKGLCGLYDRLKSVALPYCPDLNDKFVISLCESNVNITQLDLTSCLMLTDASLQAITNNLGALRSLRLAYCRGISDLGVLGFTAENGHTTRHIFDHDHEGCPCTRERDSKIFNKPKGLLEKHKHYVTKMQTKLENGEIPQNNLSSLKLLQVLDLSSCGRITDLGITKTVVFKELRCLSLGSLSQITSAAISHVALKNPSLEEVSLRGNGGLTDQAVADLAAFCPRLTSLDISQCDQITNMSLGSLAAKAKRLTHLDISFCGKITQEKVYNLELLLPNVKVIFRPYVY